MARNYTLRRPATCPASGPLQPPPARVCQNLTYTGGSVSASASGSAGGDHFPDVGEMVPDGLVICGISPQNPPTPTLSEAKIRFLRAVFDECPVVGFQVMKRDVLTIRKARYPDELAARLEGCKRGDITELSMESRRRLAIVASNTDIIFRSFVTVTYPKDFPCDGLIVKRHLAALIQALRVKCPQVSYLWFLEFQKRGAPHFHIFLSVSLPEPLSDMQRLSGRVRKVVRVHWPWQDWISRRWYRIVGANDPKHLLAGSAWEVIEKPDGAARYVAKEAYKTFQKEVPLDFQNVGRFWGCSRDVPPSEGFFVPCTDTGMANVFPPESFGDGGKPFPVLFGGADSYNAIANTSKDPLKIRKWKRTKRNETAPLLTVSERKRKPSPETTYGHGSTLP